MSTKKEQGLDIGDWISQAEAARLKGVSRQAIHNLVARGKLTTREVADRLLVSKTEVMKRVPDSPGRPSSEADDQLLAELMKVVGASPTRIQQRVLFELRRRLGVHPIEEELGAPAEVILEAIARSNDISKRGVRGLLAESSFKINVLDELTGWGQETIEGDKSYDFLIRSGDRQYSIQLKMQRRRQGQPMLACQALRRFSDGLYVVETQRTRGGTNSKTGENTRPYRFGDFDILAVSMAPLTGNWSDFMYTVGDWLLPRSDDATQILHFQPVSPIRNDDWTDSISECIEWLTSGGRKTIAT